jgi:hypothetical protein
MTLTRFADVISLSTSRSANLLAAGIERFVGLEHIEPENLHIRNWGLVADGVTFTSTFKRGQVLFGKRRANDGNLSISLYVRGWGVSEEKGDYSAADGLREAVQAWEESSEQLNISVSNTFRIFADERKL